MGEKKERILREVTAGEMHSNTAGEAKGAGGAPRATGCRRGKVDIDSRGRKGGLWHGRLANGMGCMENKKHTEALTWRCISMDFSLCNSNTADNAPIRQPAQSHGAGETWQCWVKWRYQMQQRRGVRREDSEGVPVSK